jgi:hypothetical protein
MLFGEIVAVYCENHTEHTDTVRTSQKTHYVSATETNRLMLFTVRTIRSTQVQSVPHRNHTEHTDTVRTSQEPYGTHRYSPYLTGTIRNTHIHSVVRTQRFSELKPVVNKVTTELYMVNTDIKTKNT